MISKLRTACVQMDAGADAAQNKKKAFQYLLQAVRRHARLVAFPENFLWRGKAADMAAVAAQTPAILREFQAWARKHHVFILLGSVLEKAGKKKFYNTSFLLSPSGKVQARYRKIHLFDVDIPGARACESRHTAPGKKPVKAVLDGISVGLTVCYDLRFPELFRFLSAQGCRIFFVPSNFTETTGKVHWEMLLKARAVENLSFVLAPAQIGRHPESKIKSFGTGLIIDPWGRVLARGSRSRGQVLIADLDLKSQARLRSHFPVLTHRRLH